MTDWPVKTLGDVCDLVGGGTPSKDRLEFYGGDIPWATVRDLNVEVLRTTEHSITAEAVKSSSSNVIPAGSVVIATRVGLGKAVIIAQDTAINQDLRGLVVKKPKELIADYLYWWYLSTVHLVVAAGTGATVQGVKLPFVSGLAIPVPPLEEQKRLVALLDAATARVTEITACYEKARTHANNLFASALREALESNPDWPIKTLGQVATFHNGRAYKQQELLDKGKYRVLRVGNFFSSKSWYWSDLELDEHKYCDKGDLLYAWSASFGPRIWDEEKVIYHYHIWKVVEESQQINRQFLKYWLEEDVERVKSASGTGTTMMHVSKGNIEARLISLPPLEEQKRIVAQLDSMRAKTSEMVAAYEAKLQAARDLRQSILESVFAGDL